MLAGVSVDYYTKLERGNLKGASDDVLHAIARALQLDEAERTHLFDLARAANDTPGTRIRRRPAVEHVRPAVQRVLDVPGDPGQKLLVYTAEPASPSQEGLDLLASWAAAPAPQRSTTDEAGSDKQRHDRSTLLSSAHLPPRSGGPSGCEVVNLAT